MQLSRLLVAFNSLAPLRFPGVRTAAYKCRVYRPFMRPIAATLSSSSSAANTRTMPLAADIAGNDASYQGEILCNRALNMANIAAVGVRYVRVPACVASVVH